MFAHTKKLAVTDSFTVHTPIYSTYHHLRYTSHI